MTTPPLDLPALRRRASAATYSTWEVTSSHQTRGAWAIPGVAATIRATRADARHIAAFDPPAVLALLDRVEAAERDLAAVTVSRDGWKTRAEAAEKKVAAVRGITKRLHAEYDALMREGFPDGPNRVDEADDLAYLIDAALDGGA